MTIPISSLMKVEMKTLAGRVRRLSVYQGWFGLGGISLYRAASKNSSEPLSKGLGVNQHRKL